MIPTEAMEADILKFMQEYWETYISGDLGKFDSLIRDDYHNIGTTEIEGWRSKAEMMRFNETIIEQVVGSLQARNRKTHIMPLSPYLMIHEYVDLFIHTSDEWVLYSKMRYSSLIEKNHHGWQVIHQHGSVPDSKAQVGETIGFQKISQENQELEKGDVGEAKKIASDIQQHIEKILFHGKRAMFILQLPAVNIR